MIFFSFFATVKKRKRLFGVSDKSPITEQFVTPPQTVNTRRRSNRKSLGVQTVDDVADQTPEPQMEGVQLDIATMASCRNTGEGYGRIIVFVERTRSHSKYTWMLDYIVISTWKRKIIQRLFEKQLQAVKC